MSDAQRVFAAFRSLVDTTMMPALRQFGFGEQTAHFHYPEMWVTARNHTTELSVHFEFGTGAWIMLRRLVTKKRRIVPSDGRDLNDLLRIRAADRAESIRMQRFAEAELAAHLQAKALAMRDYCADVLNGDFSVFDATKELVDDRRRRNDAEMENL